MSSSESEDSSYHTDDELIDTYEFGKYLEDEWTGNYLGASHPEWNGIEALIREIYVLPDEELIQFAKNVNPELFAMWKKELHESIVDYLNTHEEYYHLLEKIDDLRREILIHGLETRRFDWIDDLVKYRCEYVYPVVSVKALIQQFEKRKPELKKLPGFNIRDFAIVSYDNYRSKRIYFMVKYKGDPDTRLDVFATWNGGQYIIDKIV